MRNAISLFCSSGIGDLGLQSNNVETVVANELLPERMKLFSANFPSAKCFCGDIWDIKEDIINYYLSNYKEPPFLILATPPCQGMSSNGMGTMLRNFKKGCRSEFDERNRLIIPALDVIKKLSPEWVIFENVPNMVNTYIFDEDEQLINIIEYIHKELPEYVGDPKVVDVADYGVPQHRKRLITILTKDKKGIKYYEGQKSFFPMPTHSKTGDLYASRWITLKDAIGNLPPLRAEKGKNIDPNNPLHKVPVLDEKKLWWIANTPEGQTALNNQCVNPNCLYQNNKCHGSNHDEEGVNKANLDTPLYCEKCGELLPRPYVENKATGEKRIMKAFVSAYKRMFWDEPSSTLTQNFQYACSDNKLHPSQDRVLSLYEGLIIQTISNYPYIFNIEGKQVPDGLIRDTIGESVPPLLIDQIVRNLLEIVKA